MTTSPPPPLRAGLVRPVRTTPDGEGGPTVGQARGKKWRRCSQGLYVPVEVTDEDVEQRIVEAAAVLPSGAAVTGWAALRWRGGRWFSGLQPDGTRRPVTLLVGTHDIRPQPGFVVCAESVDPALVDVVDGLPVHDPRAAVSFEMRYARELRRAVVVLDMAAYSDLVSIKEVQDFLTPGQNSWTGVPLARTAIGHGEENSWSPQEVGMRLVWTLDAGRRAPLANRPVFDLDGQLIGTPDLIDPKTGVVGEYDGRAHLDRERRDADIVRESVFRRHGLEPVTMTAADRHDPAAFIGRLRDAFSRAAARPPSDRRWTLTPPPWWVSTATVALRRSLTPDQQARLLRYRAV